MTVSEAWVSRYRAFKSVYICVNLRMNLPRRLTQMSADFIWDEEEGIVFP
jgi:hypothetical protein